MFLARYTVPIVTYCVTKMITMCSPIIGHSFDIMIVASTDKEKNGIIAFLGQAHPSTKKPPQIRSYSAQTSSFIFYVRPNTSPIFPNFPSLTPTHQTNPHPQHNFSNFSHLLLLNANFSPLSFPVKTNRKRGHFFQSF